MNLTRLSELVRKVIIAIVATFLIYITYRVALIPMGKTLYATLFPPKNLPTALWGKLPPPEFIPQKISGSNTKYQLNTADGRLPRDLPDKMIVFRYKEIPFSYEAGKEASQQAQLLGFSDAELTTNLKGDVYQWRDSQTGSTLEIEINTKEIRKNTSFIGKSRYYVPGSINKGSAVGIAEQLFGDLGKLNGPLYPKGKQKVTLGKFQGDKIVEAKSVLEAQIAKVDFFRTAIDFPVYGPNPKEGLLQAYVGKTSEGLIMNHPYVHAYYWELEHKFDATYGIIPVSMAWDAVQNGKAVVANVTPEGKSPFEPYTTTYVDRILVNDIYLAYYDSMEPQKYMQPIYVFDGNYISSSGRGDITLYFPAVSGEYIEQPQTPQPRTGMGTSE